MASAKKTPAKSGKTARVETKKPAAKKGVSKASAAKKKITAKVSTTKTVKSTAKPRVNKMTKVTAKQKAASPKKTAKTSTKSVEKVVKKLVKIPAAQAKTATKKTPVKKITKASVVKPNTKKLSAKGASPAAKKTSVKVIKKTSTQRIVKSKNNETKSSNAIKNQLQPVIKSKATETVKKKTPAKVIKEKTSSTQKTKVKSIKTIEKGKQMVETIDTTTPIKNHTEMLGKSHHMVAGIEGLEPYKPNEGEAYMSDGQVKHFRIILESMRRQLMEDVDRTVNDMRDSDKNLSDFTDRATNEEEMFFMLRTRTREGKLLKKIEEALDRLEHSDYGYCDGCGVEIGIRRLEARPTATLCIDCKTLDEIREKQRGS